MLLDGVALKTPWHSPQLVRVHKGMCGAVGDPGVTKRPLCCHRCGPGSPCGKNTTCAARSFVLFSYAGELFFAGCICNVCVRWCSGDTCRVTAELQKKKKKNAELYTNTSSSRGRKNSYSLTELSQFHLDNEGVGYGLPLQGLQANNHIET